MMCTLVVILCFFGLCVISSFAQYTPTANITIEKDEAGVVHVTANTELDLFYGQGRALAQERLWEADFNRRVAKGALSAILGEGGLGNDYLMRTIGFWNLSQEAEKLLVPADKAILSAFVSGINSYISSNATLTIEYSVFGYAPEPFAVADVILITKFMSWSLSTNYQSELFRFDAMFGLGLSKARINSLFPNYEDDFPTTISSADVDKMGPFSWRFDPLPSPRFSDPVRQGQAEEEEREVRQVTPASQAPPKLSIKDLLEAKGSLSWIKSPSFVLPASNGWTVSGSRTASGKPLLLNDPHLNLNAPSIWILFSLRSPTLNATGASIVGTPGITSGRNDKIAWGVTNAGADVQDLFSLQLGPQNKTYIHKNKEYNFVVRSETIKVRGKPDVVLPVRETLYGPVVSDILNTYGQTLALQWTSLTHVNDPTILAFVGINKATNFQQFRQALKKYYIAPSQNFIYADVEGNIGYQCPGKIPVRNFCANGEYVASGSGRDDWIGYIQFEELPYAYNPDKGYIVNANNKIAASNYPYLILNDRDWTIKYRASRIEELIKTTRRHTVATMTKIQNDQVTAAWSDMKNILRDTVSTRLSQIARDWRRDLLAWDGDLSPNGNKATVFEFWMYELGRIGNFSGYAHVLNPFYIFDTFNRANHRLDVYATDAFQRTIDILLRTYNGTVPLWGDVQTLHIEHPLLSLTPLASAAKRQLRRGGDSVTISVATPLEFSPEVENPFSHITFGPSYRQIIDITGKDMEKNSVFVLPGGESGNISSPFYANLLPLWNNGQYVPQRLYNFTAISTQVV